MLEAIRSSVFRAAQHPQLLGVTELSHNHCC